MADVVDRYLLPTERVVFEVRRHWAALSGYALYFALFLAGGFLFLGVFQDVEPIRLFASSFILLSTVWFGWLMLDWHIERLVVTPKRVILISGILTRKVAIMPLTKVTDLTYQQSVFGRILDYGTFIVESAGQDQALSRIDFISGPDLHYQQVSTLLFGNDAPVDPDDAPPSSPPRRGARPTRPPRTPRPPRAPRFRWRAAPPGPNPHEPFADGDDLVDDLETGDRFPDGDYRDYRDYGGYGGYRGYGDRGYRDDQDADQPPPYRLYREQVSDVEPSGGGDYSGHGEYSDHRDHGDHGDRTDHDGDWDGPERGPQLR